MKLNGRGNIGTFGASQVNYPLFISKIPKCSLATFGVAAHKSQLSKDYFDWRSSATILSHLPSPTGRIEKIFHFFSKQCASSIFKHPSGKNLVMVQAGVCNELWAQKFRHFISVKAEIEPYPRHITAFLQSIGCLKKEYIQ